MSTCKSCKTTCYCLLDNGGGTKVTGTGELANAYQIAIPGQTWGYSCAITRGTQFYLNGSNQAVTVPSGTASILASSTGSGTITPSQTAGNVTASGADLTNTTYTNPSACYTMQLQIYSHATYTANVAAAGSFIACVGIRSDLNGSGYNDYVFKQLSVTTVASFLFNHSVEHIYFIQTLAASGAFTVKSRGVVTWIAGTSASMAFTVTMNDYFMGITV